MIRSMMVGLSLVVTGIIAGFSSGKVSANVIELTAYNDYAPFVSDQILNGGLHTEIVRESFKAVGYSLKLTIMPWERGAREVEVGAIVGSFSWVYTEDRAKRFLLSEAFYFEHHKLFTRLENVSSSQEFIESLEKRSETLLCKVYGWHTDSLLMKLANSGKLRIIRTGDLRTCFEMLALDRIHYVHAKPFQAAYVIASSTAQPVLDGMRQIDWWGERKASHHIMFSRNQAGQRASALFSKGLSIIRKNGLYRKVLDQHIALYPWIDEDAFFRDLKEHGLIGVK